MKTEPVILNVDIASGGGDWLIAPLGLSTPHAAPIGTEVHGGTICTVSDPFSAQHAMLVTPTQGDLRITWRFIPTGSDYPDQMFVVPDSRFTRFDDQLRVEMRSLVTGCGSAGINKIANHVAGLFTYGHPDTRFYEDFDEIPLLCDITEGSCLDINAYFIACCRAAGYEAGYVTGYFIPEEKRTTCEDMHCWVVTRAGDEVQEWDIAHHLKMGRRDIQPGLNPKPGVRVPMAHSMGLNFPAIGLRDIKLIAEPMWLCADGSWRRADLNISLEGYDLLN